MDLTRTNTRQLASARRGVPRRDERRVRQLSKQPLRGRNGHQNGPCSLELGVVVLVDRGNCGKPAAGGVALASEDAMLLADAEPSRKERGHRGVRPRHPAGAPKASRGRFLKWPGTASITFRLGDGPTAMRGEAPGPRSRGAPRADASCGLSARPREQGEQATISRLVGSLGGNDRVLSTRRVCRRTRSRSGRVVIRSDG